MNKKQELWRKFLNEKAQDPASIILSVGVEGLLAQFEDWILHKIDAKETNQNDQYLLVRIKKLLKDIEQQDRNYSNKLEELRKKDMIEYNDPYPTILEGRRFAFNTVSKWLQNIISNDETPFLNNQKTNKE